MKTKKISVSTLIVAFLMEMPARSQALTISLYIDPVTPASLGSSQPAFSAGSGIASTAPVYNTIFAPDAAGFNHNYTMPSVVRYGDVSASGPIASGLTGTYTDKPAAFTFILRDGAEASPTGTLAFPTGPATNYHRFLVEGYLGGGTPGSVGTIGNDSSGIPFSTTSYTITKFFDFDSSTNAILSTDPKNNQAAFLISEKIGNNNYSIWVDATVSIPPPNGALPLTLSGYVTSVPEPGSVAMMVGMGVSGGLLLLRRKRSKA